ncbi:ribosome silencing factor [Acetobacter sp. TBRC 12305]|uniref:Ribosomal silencing factor RsfS n=1 Tax=Acetobacter garciniae TaxID=2817435 RepID=A0A939HLB9_9PROT|nr:ribosome silencing factor [Acetobacter garciniae]MBX0346278.1 ribosome silencing factor [Acetobacter garciniae]
MARKPPAETPARPRSSTAARSGRATPTRAVAGAAAAPGSVRKKAAAAGPKTRTKREAVAPDLIEQSLSIITASLEDDKAEDIVVIDLTGRASFADRMVVATGLADRQIAAMAQHIERKLREIGIKRVLVEGANGSDWVLLDTGDIVVHLFKPEARGLYGLEKMWGAELDEGNEDSVTRL